MELLEKLASLICPDLKHDKEYYEKLFAPRGLKEDAKVTRFAPSPTGFLHTGSLFTAFVCSKFAHDSNGIFYLRIEDTDTKREVAGSIETVLAQLKLFNVNIDEGYGFSGKYGPYLQSERADIYNAVIYDMILKGQAYPCFCTSNELETIRDEQTANKIRPGYYGKYAKCRNLSVEEAIARIENGTPYVVRFRSNGNFDNHIDFHDEIRGDLKLSENDMDIVIRKSDGLPTYHFAHACDDHFMHTTHVIRGEEWLSSAPVHYELFNTLGFELPHYAHLPVIMKNDNGKRRKLSKRHDMEASVDYFIEQGYPTESLIIYLCTIANSNFEEWYNEHPNSSLDEFKLDFNKFSLDGALFDLEKINNISKDIIFKMDDQTLLNNVLTWSSKYDKELYELIKKDEKKFITIMNFGKNNPQPRKDYIKYSDIKEHICYMYNEVYDTLEKEANDYASDLFKSSCDLFIKDLESGIDLNSEEYFNHLKELARTLNFAMNKKDLRDNNLTYMFSDFMAIIRIALTSRKNSFDLVDIINTIGKDETIRRLKTCM